MKSAPIKKSTLHSIESILHYVFIVQLANRYCCCNGSQLIFAFDSVLKKGQQLADLLGKDDVESMASEQEDACTNTPRSVAVAQMMTSSDNGTFNALLCEEIYRNTIIIIGKTPSYQDFYV